MLTVPWPPTVNTYWRHVGHQTLISHEGRVYRVTVGRILMAERVPTYRGPLDVCLAAAPPDRRRRDLDNLPKALLDALQRGGLYEDDSQIDRLLIQRCEPTPGGSIVVTVRPRRRALPRLG